MNKPRLSLPGPPSQEELGAARRVIWAGWIEECMAVQDTLVELMLDELTEEDNRHG